MCTDDAWLHQGNPFMQLAISLGNMIFLLQARERPPVYLSCLLLKPPNIPMLIETGIKNACP